MAVGSYNHFPEIAEALHGTLAQIVKKTAFEIATDAANNAPVDTGTLRASIYVAAFDESTYGAGGFDTPGDSYIFPEVETPHGDLTAYVAVGVNYGAYVELGTRFMAPQPYFYPAVEYGRVKFEYELGEIDGRLKGTIR